MSKVFTLKYCSPNQYYRVISVQITVVGIPGIWTGPKTFQIGNPAHTTIITIDPGQEQFEENSWRGGNIIYTYNKELQLFYDKVKSDPHTSKYFYISGMTKVKIYNIGSIPEADIEIGLRLF